MGMLERGASWLAAKRHAFMTKPILYQRGALSLEMNATIGRTVFEEADELNVIHRTESRDYLVRAVDLVEDSQAFLPAPGDRIVEDFGEAAQQYEVMSLANEPPYRWADSTRETLRIHTKAVTP